LLHCFIEHTFDGVLESPLSQALVFRAQRPYGRKLDPVIINLSRFITGSISVTAFFRLFKNSRGATMVEYAIMLALIALFSIGTISALGSSINHGFKTVAGCMGSGGGTGGGGSANGGGGGSGCTGGAGAANGGGGSGGGGTGNGGGLGGGGKP
jgi:Flp pilus assembly pilin Flp